MGVHAWGGMPPPTVAASGDSGVPVFLRVGSIRGGNLPYLLTVERVPPTRLINKTELHLPSTILCPKSHVLQVLATADLNN